MQIKTRLSGVTFRELPPLKIGDEVSVVHEKDNQYDPHAMMVLHGDAHIGYIPKDKDTGLDGVQKWCYNQDGLTGIIISLGYTEDGGDTWNDEGKGKVQSIEIELHATDVKQVNSKEGRKYVGNNTYESITSFLKLYPMDPKYLIEWALGKAQEEIQTNPDTIISGERQLKDIYEETLTQAANDGTILHDKIENYLKNNLRRQDLPENVQNFFSKIEGYEVIAVENKVTDKNLLLAGTADAVLRINGKRIQIDWKSSKKPNDKHKAQVGFYGKNNLCEEGWVVCFGADNKQGFSVGKVDIERWYSKLQKLVEFNKL
jgi:hypothetical protein